MRIGVDARSLLAWRGVTRVTRELLAALAAAYPQDDWHAFVPGRTPLEDPPPGVTLHRHRLGGRALFGAAAAVRRPRLDRLIGVDLDVVWIAAPAPVAVSRGMPYVLTLHDLSFVVRPGDFTPYERAWHRLARPAALARGAARVMSVSHAAAAEAEEHWGLPARDIAVVAPGAPEPLRGPRAAPGAADGDAAAPRPLLFVGAIEPRKAPEVLAAAYRLARAEGLRNELHIVGDGRLRHVFEGIEGIRLLGPRRPSDVAPLYAAAQALVLPSLYEGYGLPPIEALAHGTPAVVSDLSVYDETVGDGVLRVAPGDVRGLADALARITTEPGLREALVRRGRESIAHLTWEAAAHRARAVLADAAATRA